MFDRRQKRARPILPIPIIKKIMNDKIQGIIRHALTWAGGAFLVSGGYATDAQLPELVGAIMTIVGFAWSLWDKRKREVK